MIIFDPDKQIYYSTIINDRHYFSGFGTKSLNDGRVIHNIEKFFQENAVEHKKIVILEQIHSTNIVFYKSTNELSIEKIEETDGVITQDNNTILIVRSADCVPIIFADKSKGLTAISHQGWRGSLKRLAIKIVDMMIEYGSKKSSIQIAIGPSIGSCCYNIEDDRYYEFCEEFEQYTDKISTLRGGKRFLNLLLLNYLFLTEYGIPTYNIDYFPFCTNCNDKQFYSFRRDYKNNKKGFGEMFSFILKQE